MKVVLTREARPATQIYFDAALIKSVTRVEPNVISITETFAPARREVEDFMASTYARAFGTATIVPYPTLISLRDGNGRILAAVGFRGAAAESLYLERYLDRPIEHLVPAAPGTDPRSGIVEIGALSSRGRGASVFLFIVLAGYLRRLQFTHAVATATIQLRAMFADFGFMITEIARATTACQPAEAAWGRYYDADPRVVVGEISSCAATLDRFMPADRNLDFAGAVFPRIHRACR